MLEVTACAPPSTSTSTFVFTVPEPFFTTISAMGTSDIAPSKPFLLFKPTAAAAKDFQQHAAPAATPAVARARLSSRNEHCSLARPAISCRTT
jgi:hypothetical protein